MQIQNPHIIAQEAEIERLKAQLFEANSIIEAIREGDVDALVLNKDGQPHVYSIESADYTYRILIEKFGEGALSISETGLILYCNEYFSKLIGISAEKIVGTFLQSYIDDSTPLQFHLDNLVSGPSKGELIMIADEKRMHVYVSLSDLRPHVAAIGIVVTDLTEKRKHEESLVQYQKKLELKVNELNETNSNLEQFIHVISHDIKEPLRKILTYSSHLQETKNDLLGKSELKSLEVINSSAVRLNSLVDDLVKYAFSATKADNTMVNINKIVAEVLDDLELIISENNAVIDCADLPSLSGSKVQMRQLFSNLISNAVKYRKADVCPNITITSGFATEIDPLAPEKNYHCISITDNGIGMENSHLSKIFTIFQRLHMRDEYSGNGIGLAICKKIMENHLGKIAVDSVPGTGSTFNLYFPVSQ